MTEPETPTPHPTLLAEVDPAELAEHVAYLDELRADAAGKPPHAAYIEAALAIGENDDDPPLRRGVSPKVALAILDDVWTARQHRWPRNGTVTRSYRDLRLKMAQHAAEQAARRRRREAHADTLVGILNGAGS